MKHIHGTCSLCGGNVTTPDVWMGINPPIPTCERCGAVPKAVNRNVIEMEKPGNDSKQFLTES